jgi:hypothetical protein
LPDLPFGRSVPLTAAAGKNQSLAGWQKKMIPEEHLAKWQFRPPGNL